MGRASHGTRPELSSTHDFNDVETAMSTIIRYKVVGGAEGEDLRASEADAREALEQMLDRYLARGHRISNVDDEYVIEDSGGNLVATYELIH
jgi:hypothetical protein